MDIDPRRRPDRAFDYPLRRAAGGKVIVADISPSRLEFAKTRMNMAHALIVNDQLAENLRRLDRRRTAQRRF